MPKSNSLQAVLDRRKASLPKKDTPMSQTGEQKPEPPERAPSRQGKHLIGGHFSAAMVQQIKILAAEESTTVQNLLTEALNDLLVKKGKQRLTPV